MTAVARLVLRDHHNTARSAARLASSGGRGQGRGRGGGGGRAGAVWGAVVDGLGALGRRLLAAL